MNIIKQLCESAPCKLSSNCAKVRGDESHIRNSAQERAVTNNVCESKNMRLMLLPLKDNTQIEESLLHRISDISM